METSRSTASSENIKVVVRCRPLNRKELESQCQTIVEVDPALNMITLTPPEKSTVQLGDGTSKSFTFDHVFPPESTQIQIYDAVTRPIVQNVLEGYNGTIFAYGQTGTGKTFTMEGDQNNSDLKGIIPNSFAQIFSCVDTAEGEKYLVRCSYLEIYNENIRDLLCDDQTRFLELKENKDKEVFVKDLSSIVVCDAEDMDRLLAKGNKNRSVAFTSMNADSSRSHAIFSVVVECSKSIPGLEKYTLRMGKLNLVDLAGSERLSKTHATGDRLKEATKINLSLSSLGNVISALVDGSSHIPYRNSKLTRLLQDSLGGNSKTVMVANIGPADFNFEETLSTLRYANRAKNIRNCAKINEDPKDAYIRTLRDQLFHLRNVYEQKKHELKEKKCQKTSGSTKKKRNAGAQQVSLDEEIGTLLAEQKIFEKRHQDDLKALLEPYGIRADGSPNEIMEQLERRKSALKNDEKAMKEDTERLLEELQQTTDAMLNSKRQCKVLFHRVMLLESQLQQSELNDQELKVKKKELAEQKLREESVRKALELKKLTSLDLKEELNKLHNEIEEKRKKANRLSAKMEDHKNEIQRLKYSHLDHLDQMGTLRSDLTKELKLKKMIVDNFVPRKVLKKLETRMRYDEIADKYVLAPRTDLDFEQPPVNRMLINPYLNLTRYTNLSSVNNIYHSNENLLAVEPEPPVSKLQELVLEEEDSQMQTFIAETMRELTQELVIVCDHRKGVTHK